MIARQLTPRITHLLEHFPAVGIVGARQVGKTTLARQIAGDIPDAIYLDLERQSDLRKLDDPDLYLRDLSERLVVLDEVQRLPELFAALRPLIDDHREKNGRFLLLGSASPSLIRGTSESLAGRIAYQELLPFTLGEVADTARLWLRGGFPDSYLASSEELSATWRRNFLRTFIERDIPAIAGGEPAKVRRFWTMMAHCQGQLWNASKISASIDLDRRTVDGYLDILAGAFVLLRLQPYWINIKKRLVKSPKIFIRDSGILHELLGVTEADGLRDSPHSGSSWESFAIEQIRARLPEGTESFFYRTSGGAEIDLVTVRSGRAPVAIEIKRTTAPRASKGLRNGMADIGARVGFVVFAGEERYGLTDGIEALPINEAPEVIAAVI